MPPDGSGTPEAEARLERGHSTGSLELAFAADGEGRTFLRRQYASYPFHVCRALYHDKEHPGLATLYVQSCSGGVYEDDSLDLTLIAGEGAEAHVSTQSATVVHTMPSGSAEQRVHIAAEPRSYLEYLPDPQILFPGSRFSSEIVVRLNGDGAVLVSDAFLQHDPHGKDGTFSIYRSTIAIEDESGIALAVDRMRIEGEAFRGSRHGVSGRYAAQGTLIVAGLDLPRDDLCRALRNVELDPVEAVVGCSQLPNEAGVVVRVLAADGAALRTALHEVWSVARLVLKGSVPAERRK